MFIQKVRSHSINDVIRHYKNKRQQKKAVEARQQVIDAYLKEHNFTKLQIGSGPYPMQGWLNTDLAHNDKVAYLDAGKKFPLPDQSMDVIFCEHLFEHLDFGQAMNMLTESYRVLKPKGRLRIATPDIEFLFNLNPSKNELHKRYVIDSFNRNWNLKPVKETFSSEEYHEIFVINNFFKDWGHQIVHNFSSLDLMLKKAGFASVIRQQVGQSELTDLQNIEQHHQRIGVEFNNLETMVVEAIKG